MKYFYHNIIRKYLGWRNWAVFYYNSIIENIFLFFYIALATHNNSTKFLCLTISFILFSLLSTTYGYLINDYADRELDRLHGKPNTFHEDSPARARVVLGMVLVGSALFALPFIANRDFLFLWGLWWFIATFYSLPPLRFKERGKFGLVLVVLAQRVIPAMIVFAAFRYYQMPDVLILLNYILAKGFASDMNHQLADYHRDVQTGTRTSAVELGVRRLESLFRAILRYERVSLWVVILMMTWRFWEETVWGIPIFQFLWIPATLMILFAWYLDVRYEGDIQRINPFVEHQRNIFQFTHLAFPHVVLSMLLILILIPKNFCYLGLLFILLIIYQMFNLRKIKFIIRSWKASMKDLKEKQ